MGLGIGALGERRLQLGRRLEAALDQLAQEGGDDPCILRRGLHEAKEALLSRRGDVDRDDHLIVGE